MASSLSLKSIARLAAKRGGRETYSRIDTRIFCLLEHNGRVKERGSYILLFLSMGKI